VIEYETRYICMYINAAAYSVMLYLQHDFYNIIFKIKHKLYIFSRSDPHPCPRKSSGCAPVSVKYMLHSMFPFRAWELMQSHVHCRNYKVVPLWFLYSTFYRICKGSYVNNFWVTEKCMVSCSKSAKNCIARNISCPEGQHGECFVFFAHTQEFCIVWWIYVAKET
jgi:hypothetical protein